MLSLRAKYRGDLVLKLTQKLEEVAGSSHGEPQREEGQVNQPVPPALLPRSRLSSALHSSITCDWSLYTSPKGGLSGCGFRGLRLRGGW